MDSLDILDSVYLYAAGAVSYTHLDVYKRPMFDTTTTIFLYDGDSQVSARGDVNPSISVPVTDQSNVAGSVFLLTPASDGEIELELYIYTNKLFNVYDNTNQTYIAQGEVFGAEGHHTYTFEGKAGNEYYLDVYKRQVSA